MPEKPSSSESNPSSEDPKKPRSASKPLPRKAAAVKPVASTKAATQRTKSSKKRDVAPTPEETVSKATSIQATVGTVDKGSDSPPPDLQTAESSSKEGLSFEETSKPEPEAKESPGPTEFQRLVFSTYTRFSYRFENPQDANLIPTGFENLDGALKNFQPGELITLASLSGIGKSWFAHNLTWNVATQTTLPVLVFDFQIGREGWMNRLFCRLSKVDVDRFRRGALYGAERSRITFVANQTQPFTICIEDDMDITPPDVRQIALKAVREYGPLGLIVVDYLETLRWPKSATQFVDERSQVVRALKSLARETQVPVLVLSHLKELPHGVSPGQRLAQVGGDSLLIAESDIVLLMRHPLNYNSGMLDAGEVAIEIEILKHRHSRAESVFFAFQPSVGQFTELPQRKSK